MNICLSYLFRNVIAIFNVYIKYPIIAVIKIGQWVKITMHNSKKNYFYGIIAYKRST